MRRSLVLAAALAAPVTLLSPPAPACTTAVVSGKATPDGRPLLWKNRDTDDRSNQVVYRADGRYPYLAVVNGGDTVAFEAWAGVNTAGFAIMNSVSYNLGPGDSVMEGQLMRLALQTCRTVEDFAKLLAETDGTGVRDTLANFGVIDAAGGAAIFETDKKSFRRFDAADAPGGVLVRSNFSDTGESRDATGLLRRARAERLVDELRAKGTLDARHLLADVARDVANERLQSFPAALRRPGAPRFVYVGDSISRDSTASASVFEGVRPGEDPALTTYWILLGQTSSGVAVPLWAGGAAVPPELAAGAAPAPLGAVAAKVRARLCPDERGDLKRYFDADALFGTGGDSGVRRALLALEGANFDAAAAALARWRQTPPKEGEARALAAEIARRTLAGLEAWLASSAPL